MFLVKRYEKSAGIFLDKASCGSSIRWGVTVGTSTYRRSKDRKRIRTVDFNFEIALTDCSRTVKWDGDLSPRLARKKLLRAIKEFQRALAAVTTATKVVKRLKEEQ